MYYNLCFVFFVIFFNQSSKFIFLWFFFFLFFHFLGFLFLFTISTKFGLCKNGLGGGELDTGGDIAVQAGESMTGYGGKIDISSGMSSKASSDHDHITNSIGTFWIITRFVMPSCTWNTFFGYNMFIGTTYCIYFRTDSFVTVTK